jgi:hypothetical protein
MKIHFLPHSKHVSSIQSQAFNVVYRKNLYLFCGGHTDYINTFCRRCLILNQMVHIITTGF